MVGRALDALDALALEKRHGMIDLSTALESQRPLFWSFSWRWIRWIRWTFEKFDNSFQKDLFQYWRLQQLQGLYPRSSCSPSFQAQPQHFQWLKLWNQGWTAHEWNINRCTCFCTGLRLLHWFLLSNSSLAIQAPPEEACNDVQKCWMAEWMEWVSKDGWVKIRIWLICSDPRRQTANTGHVGKVSPMKGTFTLLWSVPTARVTAIRYERNVPCINDHQCTPMTQFSNSLTVIESY